MTLMLMSAQSYAVNPELKSDVRCIVVGMSLAGKADPTRQTSGTMLVLYFMGRLDARVPHVDTEKMILSEATLMTPEDLAAEATRCGGALEEKGHQITSIGNKMMDLGRELLRSPEASKS